jgi:hypothetical protein
MWTITSELHHEKISTDNDEIILNGPPNNLQGHISIQNNQDEKLRIRSLPLIGGKNSFIEGKNNAIKLWSRLNPGETKLHTLQHEVHHSTAPGTYENFINIGGKKRKVKMIVQAFTEIELSPNNFYFENTSPGVKHDAVSTLANLGNVPFQIPDVKHIATLDIDMLCRAFGVGFRVKNKKTLLETFDEVTQNLKENLTDWATISIAESGQIVEPGKSILLHITFTMPKNADPKNDYNGMVRFWDKDISFNVKSISVKSKTKSYGK